MTLMKTAGRRPERTVEIRLRVSPEIAQRWSDADPSQRRRAEVALVYSMMTKEEIASELGRYMDQTGEEAGKRGWTDADNEALLNGDYD